MAIAFVQATSGTNAAGATSTTPTAAFTNPTVSGNTILVAIANDGAVGAVTSVTDTQFNVYVKEASSSSTVNTEIWAAYNITGGSSNVVTANQGFNDGAIFAHEYSGIAPASEALDQFLAASGSGASMSVGPTSPDIAPNELVFVAGEMDVVGANSLSVGPSYGNFTTASSNNIRGAVESLVVTGGGAQTATMVMNSQGGASWRITMATFRGPRVGLTTNYGRRLQSGDGMSVNERAF